MLQNIKMNKGEIGLVKVKRFLIVLVIILLLNPISSTQFIKAEESFIEISNSDELADIEKDLTGNYVLTDDIDLIDVDWKPINDGQFSGTLIGNEFMIKNMPHKYLDDESLGLFAEVEDINNLDVKIEFAAEETEEFQVEEDANAIVNIEKVESTEQLKEDKSEEVTDEEQVKQKQSKIATQATGKSVDVRNFDEFKKALEDGTVTEINLTWNISASSSGSSSRIGVAAREVIINGNGYEIRHNAGGSYSMMQVHPGTVNNTAKITFKNMDIIFTSGNSLLTDAGAKADWQVVFEDVNAPEIETSNGRLVNATHAHVVFKGNVNYTTTSKNIINDAKSVTVEPEAVVSMLTQTGQFYETGAANAELHIKSGGKLDVEGFRGQLSLIEFRGTGSKINVAGGTLNIISDRVYKDITGDLGKKQKRSGLVRFTGNGAVFDVNNAGQVNVAHTQGSILYMSSNNGKINISDKDTKVMFTVKGEGTDSNHDAVVHLDKADSQAPPGYELNVNSGAYFEVMKDSGAGMGIRVGQGSGHKVNVTDAAKFKVHNKGNGVALDPAGENAKNQALYYNGALPEFNLTGKGSEVELIADYGVAMHMTSGGTINVNPGTTMIAKGRTASAKNGIIDTGGGQNDRSTITLDNPAFFDFRNENTDGLVFLVGNLANIKGFNTDIAFWKNKVNVNLDGPHTYRYVKVFRYEYHGENFKNFGEAYTVSEGLKEMHKQLGEGGLNAFARISGNNAQAVVDQLYPATNADQKIYAHVTVDEGIFGTRDVYTDEVEVDILHTKANGTEQILKGKTIGKDKFPDLKAYEIYEKPVDPEISAFGWAEIVFPNNDFLETGDTIKVTGARIKATNHTTTESDYENLFNETRTVVDVVPPTPTKILSSELTNYSRSLKGTLTEKNVIVSVEVNGKNSEGEVEYDRGQGTFIYTFNERLKVGDKVQVFLTDDAGIAEGLSLEDNRPDRPVTNNERGNINPREWIIYHDELFVGAPIITVVKVSEELTFVSAPKELNFEVKVKPRAEEYLVNIGEIGSDLIIRDTRPSKSKWELSARMSKQLTAVDDETLKLKNALIYRDTQGETTVNGMDSVIKSHKYESSEAPNQEWNLSSDPEEGWGQGDNGLFIRIEPGVLKKDYVGEVTWTLSDTP